MTVVLALPCETKHVSLFITTVMYALKVMTITEKQYSKCSVFAFGFETRIKTILPLINEALLVADQTSSCCDTRLQTSHLSTSSVDYRLLRVIQECVCQKQQGTWNIVDELWLLTECHFINGMTYYISQGRVEMSVIIGGTLCCISVQIYFSICVPKIIKILCGLTMLLQK